jgi:outer membrane protein TolC
VSFAQPRPGTEVLTLRTSLDRAVKNNSRLQLAQKDYDIAKAQLRQAKSLLFPRVSLNFDAVRYRQETLGLIPSEIGNVVLETSRTSANQSSTTDNLYLGRLNFVQTLYAGGRMNYTNKLSKANVKRAQSALVTLQNEVEFETASAFYGLVAAREKKRLSQDALLDVEKMVRQAGSEHARLAASAERYELRRRLSAIEQEEKELRFRYLSAMGMEYFTEVEIEGDLAPKLIDQDLQTLLVWAKNNRSEVKETVIQEEVDALSVDLSMSERYPVFRLGGGLEVRNNEFPLNQSNWNAVLDMNIPIFDGLSSPARVRESRYRADQGRLRRSQLEDAVDAEVRAAHADMEHWTDELAARQRELADLKGSEKSYVGARATEPLTQRLDYLKWRLDRATDVIEGHLQLCLANARLARALGRSVLDEE